MRLQPKIMTLRVKTKLLFWRELSSPSIFPFVLDHIISDRISVKFLKHSIRLFMHCAAEECFALFLAVWCSG